MAARLAFQRVGLQPDTDVFIRATGGQAETLAAMETGIVAGASISPPVVFEARKRGLRELIDVHQLQIPFLNASIGATRKVLTERPELGDRYLRALAQAISRIKTDRDFAAQTMGKWAQMGDTELLLASVDAYVPLYSTDPYPEREAAQNVLDQEENPAARTARPEDVVDYRWGDQLRASGFLNNLPR